MRRDRERESPVKSFDTVLYLVFAIGVLVGILALNVLCAKRLVRVARDLRNGDLRPKNVLAGVFGGIVWLFLAACLLVVVGTMIVTFFFMKSGSASGIPLAMAMTGFPLACALGEWLFSVCFSYDRGDAPGAPARP